ncbi:MAG: hypothetical protein AB1716_16065 [Planctomycetota bacterium]
MSKRRRRGVLLLLVLVTLVLLAAVIAPLATLGGTAALDSVWRGDALRHRLAVESFVAIWPQWLAEVPEHGRGLDRANCVRLAFDLDGLPVEVVVRDDTAKLPVSLLRGSAALRPALESVQTQLGLGLRLAPDLAWNGCLDDLFAEPEDGPLYGTVPDQRAWAACITPFGRTAHAYRAAPAVLEAVLADLQPGLGLRLAQRRSAQAKPDLEALLGGAELPDAIRRRAQERLTTKTDRYSFLIRTGTGGTARQQYVICTADRPATMLLNWEVAP